MHQINEQSYSHQATLLKGVLKVIAVFSLLIGSLNVVVFASYQVASFNFLSVALATLVYGYFLRTKNLKVASWLTCLFVIFNVAVFIHLTKGENYALLWVMVLPPIVFFLLGRKLGAWVVGLIFVYVIGYMYFQLQPPRQDTLGMGALLNITEVCLALWFIFRFYESSRESAYREIEHQSITDKLTRLYNRSKLDHVLAEVHHHLQSGKYQRAAIAILDIDHFKDVNDRVGHIVGDEVLQHVARELKHCVTKHGVLGRWGGEEFLVLLPSYSVEDAVTFCEQVRRYIERGTSPSGEKLTISIGVAPLNATQSTEHALIAADRALYQAKQAGRNCVRFISDD
ncbi:GGDEF domain-containing protein [Pseudidiomarina sediminum]|uniref:diguanylate cyclase n=1 Tax=Pseudidiomarina sediminum TaxID=431675 RepID=A0A432Z2D4_9GAMM|nr:GGDEF domain-containing protein [Pseudidiomarina sediminum]RUO72062.1 GGDEF domain-containing protein [Pseudidiomarina sediminum]